MADSKFKITIQTLLQNRGVKLALAGLDKIRLGAVAVGGVLSTAFAAIGIGSVKAASDMESLKAQLEAVLGTAEEAKKAFDESFDFSVATPFSPEQIVETRIALESVGISGGAAVEKVATAAAAMGRNIIDVASAVRSMETEPLRNLGIMLKRNGDDFIFSYKDKMKQARTVSADGFAEAQQVLLDIMGSRFEGGLEKMSQTFSGLWSTMVGNLKASLADFGEQYLPSVKQGVQSVIDALNELRNSGKLKEWGQAVNEALQAAANNVTGILQRIKISGKESVKELATSSVDVVVGLFRMGAEAAVSVLLKVAPVIGKAIADQVKDALTPNMEKVDFIQSMRNSTNPQTKKAFTKQEIEDAWLVKQGQNATGKMERGGRAQFNRGLDGFKAEANKGNAELEVVKEEKRQKAEERAALNRRAATGMDEARKIVNQQRSEHQSALKSTQVYGAPSPEAMSNLENERAQSGQLSGKLQEIARGLMSVRQADVEHAQMLIEEIRALTNEKNAQKAEINTLRSQIKNGRS